MFVVLPNFCEHTDTHYDYHALPPMFYSEGNKSGNYFHTNSGY